MRHMMGTGEQTWAFIPFRMCDENTTVPKRAGHPHFDWSSDWSCHSQQLSQLNTKLAELLAGIIYSVQFTAYSIYSVHNCFI